MRTEFNDSNGSSSTGYYFTVVRRTYGNLYAHGYVIFMHHGLKSLFFGKILDAGAAHIIYAVVDDFGDLIEVGHA